MMEMEAARTAPLVPAWPRLHGARAATSAVRGMLHEHAPFLWVVGAHVAVGTLLGHPPRPDTLQGMADAARYPLLAGLLWLLGAYLWFRRGAHGRDAGVARTWGDFRASVLTDGRIGRLALASLAFLLLNAQYVGLKSGMAEYAPFAWDTRFAALDRLAHFGRDPWTILHPWLATPHVTYALDVLYYLWFPLKVAVVVFLALGGSRRLRLQGLLCYALVLALLGNGLAALLSSAGPVYYARVTGLPDPYRPLFDYLQSVLVHHDLLSLDAQAALWSAYTGQHPFPFSGISAAPSVHVALAVLFALVGWRASRWLGGALAVYAVCIFLGSVHLGWHYALDGYLSALLTLALWKGAGLWTDRHFRPPVPSGPLRG